TSNENVIWDNASFANTVLEDSVIYNSEMSETNFSGVKFLNSDIIGQLTTANFANAKKDTKSQIINSSKSKDN
ncbi:MAG: pentapeptide repeat-containing protein, partial [Rickettsiales bacterium]|nr:pentapeptide repeat-containing protein [Rickettsiales bacterium]